MSVALAAIDAVELRVVRLTLAHPFTTANGTTTARDVLLVRVRGDGLDGWGECAADTVPTYWRETVASAWADLTAASDQVPAGPMARAALEMAHLDHRLRSLGRSLSEHLGGERTAVDATVTAGFDDDPAGLVAAGYRSLKVKVSPERSLPSLPDSVAVQVDANGSLDPIADRSLLDELDGRGLALIEQPFAVDQLLAHAELSARLRTPIGLDESVATERDADLAITASACKVIVVKPSRLGGLDVARRVHDACRAAGVAAKVGGMLETGIGRAAALALAALPGFTLPADLSASARYWDDDIVAAPFALDVAGRLAVPTAPGLGIDVRLDAIEAATVQRATIRLAATP